MNASMFSLAGGGKGPRIATSTLLLANEWSDSLEGAGVPEAVGDDVIDGACGTRQDQLKSAAHEGLDAAVGRSVAFGVDDEGRFTVRELLRGSEQCSDLSF